MKNRFAVFVLAFTTLVVLSQSVFAFQDTSGRNSGGVQDETIVRIYSLRHARSPEVANALKDLFARPGIQVIADTRSNSILATGQPEVLKQLEEMVMRLDVPTSAPEDLSIIRSYQIRNHDDDIAFQVLQGMLAGNSGVRMQFDRVRNRLHISADEAVHERVRKLLEVVDQPVSVPERPGSVFVSLTLVVESGQVATDHQSALKPVAPEVTQLLNQAGEMGLFEFESPMVASSLVTKVACNPETPATGKGPQSDGQSRFQTSSERPSAGFRVEQNGLVEYEGQDKFLLKSEIGIGTANHPGQTIQTDVVAPSNHPVVLSFSSIGGVDAAIIIKLISTD